MDSTKNGITINTELEPDNRSFFSIGDHDHTYHVTINDKAALLLKRFLSDPEPVEDTRSGINPEMGSMLDKIKIIS